LPFGSGITGVSLLAYAGAIGPIEKRDSLRGCGPRCPGPSRMLYHPVQASESEVRGHYIKSRAFKMLQGSKELAR
jgi:hypothetical protein